MQAMPVTKYRYALLWCSIDEQKDWTPRRPILLKYNAMKKLWYIASLICLYASFLSAQKYDRFWMGAHWVTENVMILMEIEENGISYDSFLPEFEDVMFASRGMIAMCDARGEFQFYTNGNVVASWDTHIMEGGKGFNEGASYDDFNPIMGDTVVNSAYTPYAYMVIPDAFEEKVYYMIHAFVREEGDALRLYGDKMQISKIDMSANGGRGKVVYKNRYFDEELMGSTFTLIKHANGRDWWVVRRSQDGLRYKSILLQRDSVVQVVNSYISGLSTQDFTYDDWFVTSTSGLYASADGSMLIDEFGVGTSMWLSFDRCSGGVSLIDTIYTGRMSWEHSNGAVTYDRYYYFQFSPSGRYLYGGSWSNFAQWDLEAEDVEGSKVVLSGPPWAMDDDQNVIEGNGGGLTVFSLGPDGRIYNLFRTMHSVIEHPDEKGAACGLCLGAEHPPSCLGVPYYLFSGWYPNYRLGPLEGSGCDTLENWSPPGLPPEGEEYGVSVWPNPVVSGGSVSIEISLPDYSKGTASLEVVDVLGRVLSRHVFPPYAYMHELSIEGWASGVYHLVLRDGRDVKAVERMVVIR